MSLRLTPFVLPALAAVSLAVAVPTLAAPANPTNPFELARTKAEVGYDATDHDLHVAVGAGALFRKVGG